MMRMLLPQPSAAHSRKGSQRFTLRLVVECYVPGRAHFWHQRPRGLPSSRSFSSLLPLTFYPLHAHAHTSHITHGTEDFGVHAKQYYPLDVTYFKSSMDNHILDMLVRRRRRRR